MSKPRIGLSSCLAGKPLRYDGHDKLDSRLVQALRNVADLVTICPEVAIGMGIPRLPIQLTDSLDHPQARQLRNPKLNFTRDLQLFAWSVAMNYELDGYVFKSRSPSCGLQTTPVFIAGDMLEQTTSGVYAAALLASLPGLPATDESIIESPSEFQRFVTACISFRHTRLALIKQQTG